MQLPENTDNEEGSIGFVEWLWPVPNDITALYFVLTSASIIIVLVWRSWYELFVSQDRAELGLIAIEVIGFSPAAGFISMFVMSIAVAGGMTVLAKVCTGRVPERVRLVAYPGRPPGISARQTPKPEASRSSNRHPGSATGATLWTTNQSRNRRCSANSSA